LGGRRYEHRHAFDVQDRLTRRITRGPLVSGSGPADTVRYVYNPIVGLLDTIADVSGRRTWLDYDTERQPELIALPNGVFVTISRAWTGGPADLFYTIGGTRLPLGSRQSYDAKGRIVQRTTPDTSKFRGFAYDSAGRLIAAADSSRGPCTEYYSGGAIRPTYDGELPAGYSCTGNGELTAGFGGFRYDYGYDKVGNRTGTGSVVTAGNRVEQLVLGGQTYAFEFDEDGNLKRKRLVADSNVFNQRLTWDALGQLTQVVTTKSGTTTTVSYGYDGGGRRVRRTVGSQVTYYLWDGDELVAELAGSTGNFAVEYTIYPGVDRPHSARIGGPTGQMAYVAVDALGNVVGLTDSAGAVVRQTQYGPFGETETTSGTQDVALKWKARERDAATDLYYMRARWYDPQVGRFVSEDPIGLSGGINPYAFAGDDPVNYSDPSGLCTAQEALKVTYTRNEDGDWVETRVCPGGSAVGEMSIWGRGDPLVQFSGPSSHGTSVWGMDGVSDAFTIVNYSRGTSLDLGGGITGSVLQNTVVRYDNTPAGRMVGFRGSVRLRLPWRPDFIAQFAQYNTTTSEYAVLGQWNVPLMPTIWLRGNRDTGAWDARLGVIPVAGRSPAVYPRR
jgi:RHS repeat-associated protein